MEEKVKMKSGKTPRTNTNSIDRYPGETEDILKSIREYSPIVKYRPTKDDYYLDIAKAVSGRSTCLKRQYGAVIVNNDEIISTGYNGNPRGIPNCLDIGACNRMNIPHNSGDYSDCGSVHAEQNAMLSAARRDMIGATLYLFGREGDKVIKAQPCPICNRMIINAGIERVVATKVKE